MTKKSPAIDNVLTSICGISRQDAEKQSICTLCKLRIVGFSDALSEKEYQISGMCQDCQDKIFR